MHSTTLTRPMRDLAARQDRALFVHRRKHASCDGAQRYVLHMIAEDAAERALASDRFAPRRKRERRCGSCSVLITTPTCDFCE